MYKVNFNKDLLKDWCDYCERRKEFDISHFSTLLMEVFLEGYTNELDLFLHEITKYFDSSVYKNMKYIFSNDQLEKSDIKKWVESDLREKKKIFSHNQEAAELVTVIDNKKYLLVNDRHILYEARESDNDTLLYEEVGDYVIANSEKDNRWYAIKEVLYNIASDNDLVYAILSRTIGGNIDFQTI